jgi:hypothetical protein
MVSAVIASGGPVMATPIAGASASAAKSTSKLLLVAAKAGPDYFDARAVAQGNRGAQRDHQHGHGGAESIQRHAGQRPGKAECQLKDESIEENARRALDGIVAQATGNLRERESRHHHRRDPYHGDSDPHRGPSSQEGHQGVTARGEQRKREQRPDEPHSPSGNGGGPKVLCL